MAVTARFDRVAELGGDARAAMRALHARHFACADADAFARDLARKSHALRLLDDAGGLVGFTTLDYAATRLDGAACAVVYSGDTVVDPRGWSSASLGAAWVAAVLDLHAASLPAGAPLWWLLLTSGARTFRYLPVFCRRWHPAPPGRDDPRAAALLRRLARARFGDAYDADAGVVRFAAPQRLRAHLAAVPDRLVADRDVALFLRRNPGHADGDELVSLCRLDEDNLLPAGLRALALGRRAGAAR